MEALLRDGEEARGTAGDLTVWYAAEGDYDSPLLQLVSDKDGKSRLQEVANIGRGDGWHEQVNSNSQLLSSLYTLVMDGEFVHT